MDPTLMQRFSVFFTYYLDENYVLSLFNFSILMFIQVLISAIEAPIEDEISSHLSHGLKVMNTQHNNDASYYTV